MRLPAWLRPLLGGVVWSAIAMLYLAGSSRAAPPRPSEAEIRSRLEEVLARPEFSPQPANNVLQQILDKLARLFEQLGGLHEASPVVYWAVLLGCLVLLILLGAHIGWTVSRVFAFRSGGRRDAPVAEGRARRSQAYREEAHRKAAEGEFTEAIRCLFLSLVYHFDESGRVNFERAYTNREYLALFGDRPDVQAELTTFVDTLDDYWYAERPTDRGRYETCLALYEALQ